ncbi:MAG: hypothetical protein M1281_17710 [Chloroflexi bacterium]|nr:hypothetical protein [Chloroflexota bacterium]
MKPKYYLGADVSGSKISLLIADETGQVIGFGQSMPGNHEGVGYDDLTGALIAALRQALPPEITPDQIAGAGFGVGGYDFPSETKDTFEAIAGLGLNASVAAANLALIVLLAGSAKGWGVAVVADSGCSCWGWDQTHHRVGQFTGGGARMAGGAGAKDLVDKALQGLAHDWTGGKEPSKLDAAIIRHAGACSLGDLIEGLAAGRYVLGAEAAALVFETARQGDTDAVELIHWVGREVGKMANSVIRQLNFQELDFEIVLSGEIFLQGGLMVTDPLLRSIRTVASRASLVRLTYPPVIGAVLLGMEAAGLALTPELRIGLAHSLAVYRLSGRVAS